MAKPIKCYDLGIDIHIVKNYNYITVYFIILKFINIFHITLIKEVFFLQNNEHIKLSLGRTKCHLRDKHSPRFLQ